MTDVLTVSGVKVERRFTKSEAEVFDFQGPDEKNPAVAGFRIGGRTRARTVDPLIKSQLLYQLSYAP